jgi:hypothetical protein
VHVLWWILLRITARAIHTLIQQRVLTDVWPQLTESHLQQILIIDLFALHDVQIYTFSRPLSYVATCFGLTNRQRTTIYIKLPKIGLQINNKDRYFTLCATIFRAMCWLSPVAWRANSHSNHQAFDLPRVRQGRAGRTRSQPAVVTWRHLTDSRQRNLEVHCSRLEKSSITQKIFLKFRITVERRSHRHCQQPYCTKNAKKKNLPL